MNPETPIVWRRCTGHGCGKNWPHPEDTEDSRCPKCRSVDERLRCIHVLERREIRFREFLRLTPMPEEFFGGIYGAIRTIDELAEEMRKLPEEPY